MFPIFTVNYMFYIASYTCFPFTFVLLGIGESKFLNELNDIYMLMASLSSCSEQFMVTLEKFLEKQLFFIMLYFYCSCMDFP